MQKQNEQDMKTNLICCICICMPFLLSSCEIVDDDIEKHVNANDTTYIALEEVAAILSQIPLEPAHLNEVHTAATSSSTNGYDEEYTMRNLFSMPGAGVGDTESKASAMPVRPLRALIEDHVRSKHFTKSSSMDPDAYLAALMSSDMQIYWPYSDRWDGGCLPVITFDPSDNSDVNEGYRLVRSEAGEMTLEKVVVDEDMAAKTPVWVVNRNSDAGYTSLEMLRREDPQWGEGGGTIIVHPKGTVGFQSKSKDSMRTLILKDFTMNRNYDSWFAGASEFFVLTITGGSSFA